MLRGLLIGAGKEDSDRGYLGQRDEGCWRLQRQKCDRVISGPLPWRRCR